MQKLVIFDLDNTVICSLHRQQWNDGILNLEHWFEGCYPENVARDSELPLADTWREFLAAGATIAVCTSRVMAEADFQWLESRGLEYHFMVSRTQGDSRSDVPFKREGLQRLLDLVGVSPSETIYYEDRADLVALGRSMGIDAIQA